VTDPTPQLVREVFIASFMAGLPPDDIAWATRRLSGVMEDVHLRAGDVLYRVGDVASEHFLIVSGELKVEAPGKPVHMFGERSLLGAFDTMIGRQRARTVTATRNTHLLRVPAGDWEDMIEDNFEIAQRAIHGLAEGVHALRLELHDFADPPSACAALPPESKLDLVERMFILRSVPLFGDADVQSLISLASLAHEVVFPAGHSVFPRGVSDDALVVVVNGSVTATHPRRAAPATFGDGAVVLGSTALSADDLGYEARATKATRAFRIAHEDYFDVMEEHFSLWRSAMKTLAVDRERLADERGRRGRAHVIPTPSGTLHPAP
jgi:CRP-like cAMP-binding protein